MLCAALFETRWYEAYCEDTKDGGAKTSAERERLLVWNTSLNDLERALSW
jgi:hypothetical protein